MNKDGFIIYKSFYPALATLTDAQIGRLFRALYEYQINGTETAADDIKPYFGFFLARFKMDEERYREKCEQARDAVTRRWDAIRANTDEYGRIQPNTELTDKIGRDKIGEDKTGKDKRKKKAPFVPPTLDEIKTYCQNNKIDIKRGEAFFYHANSKEWKGFHKWQDKLREYVCNGEAMTNAKTAAQIAIPNEDHGAANDLFSQQK